jgi:hypothetical protein
MSFPRIRPAVWALPVVFCHFVLANAACAAAPEGDHSAASAAGPLRLRGYYFTLMRMPTFDLEDWREIVDDVASDNGNMIILWVAGGFRSKLFPQTWEYNADHANVREDFVGRLIDYAHERNVRVLLGFTPFGYDGVNRMGVARPEWQAIGADGKPSKPFGIHCWGVNLCPAKEATQRFMLDYAREMAFDFYPQADGLFIESSDYAICHCNECRGRFFDHEFAFVEKISHAVWAKWPEKQIVVYPHYFSGKDVPGIGVAGAKRPFDRRWSIFFTPHSAPPSDELIAQAADAIWWDDSPALHSPLQIAAGARKAVELGCTGYIPSLESFSFVASEREEGEQYLVGRRQVPFGFGWLSEGASPYRELPVRINRLAYKAYSQDPSTSDEAFHDVLRRELFPAEDSPVDDATLDDALFLHKVFAFRRTWCQAAPLADPQRVKTLQESGRLDDALKGELRRQLDRVRTLQEKYADKRGPGAEIEKIADWLDLQWNRESEALLAPSPCGAR